MTTDSPFDYMCFISYRGDKHNLTQGFIKDLFEDLSGEFAQLTGGKVFVDWDRLRGGDLFDPALAQALCKSVCMVLVYTPMYFDVERTYCAREYQAMLELEERRLSMLDTADTATAGLIVPVVFRGADRLPNELASRRHYHDFADFTFLGHMREHHQYGPKIKEIAEYIRDRSEDLSAVPEVFEDCQTFELPEEESIKSWLEGVAGTCPPFPRA